MLSATAWWLCLATAFTTAETVRTSPPEDAQDACSSQQKDAANAQIAAGNLAMEQSRASDAIGLYRNAYEACPSPKILANLAMALADVGRLEDAADSYFRALSGLTAWPSDAAEQRPWEQAVEAYAEVADKLGWPAISLQPAGDTEKDAWVRLDGVVYGRLPLGRPLPLRPGAHDLSIEKVGYLTIHESVNVVTGTLQMPVRLLLPAVVPATAVVPLGAPAVINSSTRADVQPQPPSRTWLWIAGGALLVAGTVVTAILLSRSGPCDGISQEECFYVKM